ncbi:MAG: biotin--[acetyl-CoA-carboxylase] ligase [Dehalococcoidales bacterium]|nr:biotin--[acetyl-CoA-carboxylase] ligase [Dehalococcoidales bacterium]
MSGDNLDSASITKGLETRFIGKNVLYYSELTSTMDVARREAMKKTPEGTAVIANRQTKGKGRLNRTWVSPEDNIAVSIILYPDKKHLPSLTMLASLAVLHSIETGTGLKCQLKWPNDVLIDGKKVCGILLESRIQKDSMSYAIIGFGVNVNMKLKDYPEISSIATSLADELGRTVSRLTLIRNLFVEVENLYLGLKSGHSLLEEWKTHLVTLGKNIRVRSGEDIFEGVAESVAEDGGLLLRCPDGKLMKFMAGDVTLR